MKHFRLVQSLGTAALLVGLGCGFCGTASARVFHKTCCTPPCGSTYGYYATRWGIFHAGIQSAKDPKYTIIPQRERSKDQP